MFHQVNFIPTKVTILIISTGLTSDSSANLLTTRMMIGILVWLCIVTIILLIDFLLFMHILSSEARPVHQSVKVFHDIPPADVESRDRSEKRPTYRLRTLPHANLPQVHYLQYPARTNYKTSGDSVTYAQVNKMRTRPYFQN